MENLNSIPSRSEIGEEKKKERNQVKELSSKLHSLLVSRQPKRIQRATESGEIVLEFDGKIKVSAKTAREREKGRKR